jgi:D-lactate dehydrogenase
MKVSIFSTKSYDRQFFTDANAQHQHELTFLEPRLDPQTALLAKDAIAVCVFVNDQVDKDTLEALASYNVSLIALRSAGYNHVDVQAAKNLGMKLVRVPAYSPNAVAEHTVYERAIFRCQDYSDLICTVAQSALSVQVELVLSLPKS